jgi:hypothetical protein
MLRPDVAWGTDMYPATGIRALRGGTSVFMLASAMLVSASAHAAVTISTGATQNMSCSNGVCSPTAADAVLNVSDLGNLLASGNVTVTTTSSGVQAKDIVVKAALSWSSTGMLGLDAYRSITVDQPVSLQGLSGLTLTTNDGSKNGELSFGRKGNVTFANLSSSLTINGASYMLVNAVHGLASAIAANPSGDYALAQRYDAKQDGTYTQSPVTTSFSGTFEGLGNEISHLTITSQDDSVGFFSVNAGTIRDFGLVDLRLSAMKLGGGLASGNEGNIFQCHVSGKIVITGFFKRSGAFGGGMAGLNLGSIRDSFSTADVRGGRKASLGGLVGLNEENGVISESFAMGTLTDSNRSHGYLLGGLVGDNEAATIINSYATGAVTGANASHSLGGGLAGYNATTILQSYSTGGVTGFSYTGGLLGYDASAGLNDTYWDTDTSGITNLSQGAGYPPNDPGITGLTSQQLQSGLPEGFDPKIWAEDPKINNGFPYLINNPPPKSAKYETVVAGVAEPS